MEDLTETLWVVQEDAAERLIHSVHRTYEEASESAQRRAKTHGTWIVSAVTPRARFRCRPAEVYEEVL